MLLWQQIQIMADQCVKEGFLCPVCIADLGSISELQEHFDTEHNHEDTHMVQAFSEFIAKTRQRLRKEVTTPAASGGDSVQLEFQPFIPYIYRLPHWNAGELPAGMSRSHVDHFRHVRAERAEHWHVQCDRLALRLQRLTLGMPEAVLQRCSFERSVVPWMSDRLVSRCPGCAAVFTVSSVSMAVPRRKHHCRVCGYVVCDACCSRMSLREAAVLTDDLTPLPPLEGAHTAVVSESNRTAVVATGLMDVARVTDALKRSAIDAFKQHRLRKTRSSDSLDSVSSKGGVQGGSEQLSEWKIRVCHHCRNQLEQRRFQRDRDDKYADILQIYSRILEAKQSVVELTNQHNTQLQRLMAGRGSSATDLAEVNQQRRRLLTRVERLELMSQQMVSATESADFQPQSPLVRQLMSRIHTAVGGFIKTEVLANLEHVPTEQELIQHNSRTS